MKFLVVFLLAVTSAQASAKVDPEAYLRLRLQSKFWATPALKKALASEQKQGKFKKVLRAAACELRLLSPVTHPNGNRYDESQITVFTIPVAFHPEAQRIEDLIRGRGRMKLLDRPKNEMQREVFLLNFMRYVVWSTANGEPLPESIRKSELGYAVLTLMNQYVKNSTAGEKCELSFDKLVRQWQGHRITTEKFLESALKEEYVLSNLKPKTLVQFHDITKLAIESGNKKKQAALADYLLGMQNALGNPHSQGALWAFERDGRALFGTANTEE